MATHKLVILYMFLMAEISKYVCLIDILHFSSLVASLSGAHGSVWLDNSDANGKVALFILMEIVHWQVFSFM